MEGYVIVGALLTLATAFAGIAAVTAWVTVRFLHPRKVAALKADYETYETDVPAMTVGLGKNRHILICPGTASHPDPEENFPTRIFDIFGQKTKVIEWRTYRDEESPIHPSGKFDLPAAVLTHMLWQGSLPREPDDVFWENVLWPDIVWLRLCWRGCGNTLPEPLAVAGWEVLASGSPRDPGRPLVYTGEDSFIVLGNHVTGEISAGVLREDQLPHEHPDELSAHPFDVAAAVHAAGFDTAVLVDKMRGIAASRSGSAVDEERVSLTDAVVDDVVFMMMMAGSDLLEDEVADR